MALPMNRNKSLTAGLVREDNELGCGHVKLELPLEHSRDSRRSFQMWYLSLEEKLQVVCKESVAEFYMMHPFSYFDDTWAEVPDKCHCVGGWRGMYARS